MNNFQSNLRTILIGGSSHTGKSTLSQFLAEKLKWSYRTTDKLARHPGRPWIAPSRQVYDRNAEYYLSLTIEELLADVLDHYRNNVWPKIQSIVTSHATDLSSERLIMEGSALWPESVANLNLSNVASIYLTASDDLFEQRIRFAANYDDVTTREKKLIDKFLRRTIAYNKRMMEVINRLELVSLDVNGALSPEELSAKCLELVKYQGFNKRLNTDALTRVG